MQTIYKYLLIALLALLAQASFAQNGKLTGFLNDDKGAALPFATVAVINAGDSSLVTGSITDDAGKFTINTPAAGTYFLKLSAVGFKSQTIPAFTVADAGFSKHFGKITLAEDVEVLQAVSVEALRPKVVVEADKMVVSVEGTAMAAGSTAYDVLSKSPGVWVDQDGNIQLNGKGGVKVMLDGRPTYLSAKELQNMLEGMSSENIKNIEIIANPSAKHDAEGTAGILNINLKKNSLSGMNGNVYVGYMFNKMHGYGFGTSLNYKKDRWSSFVNLDMADRNSFRDMLMIREFNQEGDYAKFNQQSREESNNYTPSVRMGTDFDLNDRHSIGATANLSQTNYNQNFVADMSLVRTDASQNMLVNSSTPVNDITKNTALNLHYVGKLDTLGTRLSADLDYVRLTSMGDSKFINEFQYSDNNSSKQTLGNTNPSSYNIYSARVDFTKPINKSKIEMGMKASHVVSDNKLNFFAEEDGVQLPVDSMSNHFIYRENIFAAYTNFSTSINDKWSVQGGLRAEQTFSEGESLTLQQTTTRNYLNLFPSVFVQQKVSDNYQINYNYSRRIQRPRYESLNPFFVYLDPYTIAQGNPMLKPEYTHSFQMTHTYKQSYNLVLHYAVSRDFSTEVPVQDNETKTTVFAQHNIDRVENYSATLVAPVQLTAKWSVFNNAVLAYQSYEMFINNLQLTNDQVFFMVQSNHTFKLPLGFTFELNTGYRGPVAHGMYHINHAWWVHSGVKRSFLNDKLDVTLNATDIFRTQYDLGSAHIGENRNYFEQYRGRQGVSLNLRYRFSRGEKFEAKNRNNSLEELNRAGGN